MRVTIYCASSSHLDEKYFDAAERFAKALVEHKIEAVFGGGSEGLMGKLADVVVANGGAIQGIMPHFMKEIEWAHPKVSNFIFTETMAERKTLLMQNVDAIVALPGGTGTLEELFEVITLKRLGQFAKPIVILNTGGYYDPLKAMLEKSVSEKFMNPKHLEMWEFVDEPEEILPAIANTPAWKEDPLSFATLHQTEDN